MALSNEVHVPQKIPQTNPNYLPPDMSIPHDAILLSNPLVHSKVGMGMHMQSVPSAPLSVVCNLQKLEMENSSSEGHFISSTEPKCVKRIDDGKSLSKKKKTQHTSPHTDVP
ncbi:hypothetical protein Ancab_019202 [Ancistrocladus abbreviatus]